MGLDGVELILAVENSFKLALADEEAERVRTADDLFRLVLSKLEPPVATDCLTSHAFYILRSALVKQTGCARRLLSPKTNTDSILPSEGRRAIWRSLSETVGLRFPPLVRSRPVAVLTFALTVTPVIGAVFFHSPVRWLLVFSVVPVAYGSVLLTRPLATCIPRSATTLGELTRTLSSRNFAVLADKRRHWREADVWNVLRSLIADQVGLDKEEVRRESRFVEDLGFSM